jgi:hypothetical protein
MLKIFERNKNRQRFNIFDKNNIIIFTINIIKCPYCAEESIIINNVIKICFNCKENASIEFDLTGEFK